MKPLILALFLCCCCIVSEVFGKCRQPISIYENLRCKPFYRSSDPQHKQCPKSYDCSQIQGDNGVCYFQGDYYSPGYKITEWTHNLPGCVTECTCDSNAQWQCRVYSCPHDPPPNGCYSTYDLRMCCSTGYNCPNDNTLKCKGIDNRTFLLGQTFYSPTVNCAVCECQPGYTGQPNDPHCKKITCDSEIYSNQRIQSYCAPAYMWVGDCCPMSYLCPSKEDEWDDDDKSVSPSEVSDSFDSSLSSVEERSRYCRYGNRYFRIGAEFKRKYEYDDEYDLYTRCECVIPPYFTCIADPPPPDKE